MSDPVIIIEPSDVESIVMIQADSFESIGMTSSTIQDQAIFSDSVDNIEIGSVQPDNVIVKCCDTSSSTIVEEAISAKTLILEKIANETISALKLVHLDSNTHCSLADNNTDVSMATVAGLALNSGATGSIIKILVFGIYEDPFFSFGVNELLFLGANGTIINYQPASGFLTPIGHGLGSGAIQISIEKPQIL